MSTEPLGCRGMPPAQSLPLDPFWTNEESYVRSLLSFATESDLFRNLCGGVHILDFLTREPELYATVLPRQWREWLDLVDVNDFLQLLLREDLDPLLSQRLSSWHNGCLPPKSLLEYILTVRRHSLVRTDTSALQNPEPTVMPRGLVGGMKPKKIHEVQHFSTYVNRLSDFVAAEIAEPISGFVDFGSGQNYLGRALASPPYHRNVIAVERRHHNVAGARKKDVHAKLVKKEKTMRNKKEYKRQSTERVAADGTVSYVDKVRPVYQDSSNVVVDESLGLTCDTSASGAIGDKDEAHSKGPITYIEHDIEDGRVEEIIYPPACASNAAFASFATSDECLNSDAPCSSVREPTKRPRLILISLHSCGNLSHHGLRTLAPSTNPSVSAVALIGCCYNLLTERLGPATYKHPLLRSHHPRLEATGSAYDPHGFPMSKRLENFQNPDGTTGMRLNITARMMAVQAPNNWGRDDSEAFFTRHFYRALLQRMLMDAGIVKQSANPDFQGIVGGTISGRDERGTPLVIGSLRKSAFKSFEAYVNAALGKLAQDPDIDDLIRSRSSAFTNDVIQSYMDRFAYARKRLAVMWSLMAFSAGVVESTIVVDRWLWLKEQVGWVEKCWVEPVFEYKWSPRNLVVVGIRKRQRN